MVPAMVTSNLREEGDALYGLLQARPEAYERKTQFKAWTVRDVLIHLHHSDVMALTSLQGEEAFGALTVELMGAIGSGQTLIEYSRAWLGDVDTPALVEKWRETFLAMADAFDAQDPSQPLPWFGPPMRVRMFATARQMETWAHGLAIYDVLGLEREESDRIQDIVFIGTKTFKFAYDVRGMAVPEAMPRLELTSPSGALWTYGEAGENRIRGTAVDFARVATQTRAVADTDLVVEGPIAEQWMTIVQCFAGMPSPPPEPGTRFKQEAAS